jgi:hypothetical protein
MENQTGGHLDPGTDSTVDGRGCQPAPARQPAITTPLATTPSPPLHRPTLL